MYSNTSNQPKSTYSYAELKQVRNNAN